MAARGRVFIGKRVFTSRLPEMYCAAFLKPIYFLNRLHSELTGRKLPMNRFNRFLIGIACLTLVATNLAAQSIYGTLTGIVSDPSQSVVAGATVKLRDAPSGSTREPVTHAE